MSGTELTLVGVGTFWLNNIQIASLNLMGWPEINRSMSEATKWFVNLKELPQLFLAVKSEMQIPVCGSQMVNKYL